MNTVCNIPRDFALSISIKVIIHCLDPMLLMDNILCLCASSLMQFIHVYYLAHNWKYVDNKSIIIYICRKLCVVACACFISTREGRKTMGLVV